MIRKSISKTVYVALFIFLSWQCREHEFPLQEHPGIETVSAIDGESGARLRGRMSREGKNPVIDHGFLYSLHPDVHIYASEKISLGALDDAEVFEARINGALYPDTTYYVKAFAATDKLTVYGSVVSFRSSGGLAPAVKGFVPAQGTWGDTIQISGKNLRPTQGEVAVRFGEFASRVIASSDSIIECIVPRDVPDSAVSVTVKVLNQEAISAKAFVFTSPVIKSYTPRASFGETITLTGSGFSSVIHENRVRFNEYVSQIVEASRNTLKVVVPPGLNSSASKLSVEVHLRTTYAADSFRLSRPVIKSLSASSGKRGATLTIAGENFSPHLGGNRVFFEDNLAAQQAATMNEIRVTVPGGPYDSRDVKITIEVAGAKVVWSEPFTLDEPWIEKSTIPGEMPDFGVGFAIGNKGYMGLAARGTKAFYRFDPATNAWEDMPPFPGAGRDRATSFVISGKAYVGGGGRSPMLKDFWRYDPIENAWKRVADFPFGISGAVSVALNGKGYVLGHNESEGANALYSYDPVANVWKEIPVTIQAGERPASAFVVNNRIFFVVTDAAASRNMLIEFSPATSSWTKRGSGATLPPEQFVTTFAKDGKAYMMGQSGMHVYDPAANTIQKQETSPSPRLGAITFRIGDRVYYGFGHQPNRRANDFWENR